MDNVLIFLKWTNDHGLWDFVQTLIILIGFVLGLKIIFFPKKRIRNLNYFTQLRRNQHPQYALIIYLEIRNYTGRSVVISSPYFKFKSIRPDPNARGDKPEGDYEIKFPNMQNDMLAEVEYLIRNKEHVHTFIPLDPAHSDAEVENALNNRQVGTIDCICTLLEEKPRVHKLVRDI